MKRLITESKLFEGFGSATKKLLSGLLSGKVKKVKWPSDPDAKDAHTAMLNISKNLNKISDYFDEHPDEEEEFMKTLKNI